jgi:nucleotide-binding universal stress UspA family protein
MFPHILVPTDLTARTGSAIELAVRLGGGPPARLTLLHVIETVAGATFDELASFYHSLEDKARHAMEELARPAIDAGAGVNIEVRYGRRAETLLSFVDEARPDLIVLPSHRLDFSSPAKGLGTLSYRIAILSPCPVLLVK